jgi:hypothetical protein
MSASFVVSQPDNVCGETALRQKIVIASALD